MADATTIREAAIDDVRQFFSHTSAACMNGLIPDIFDSIKLRQCSTAYVAEKSGEIVGAITLDFGTEARPPELATAYVLPAHGLEGIGTRLAETAMTRMRVARPGVKVLCRVITSGMQRTLDKLPDDLKRDLDIEPSYLKYGDEDLPDDHLRKRHD
jgi:hypothetical protein